MDNRNDRFENKLDKIIDDLVEIKVTQGKQHHSLVHHIKRTDLLEKRVESVWSSYKALSVIAGLISVAAAIAEVLGYINHVK